MECIFIVISEVLKFIYSFLQFFHKQLLNYVDSYLLRMTFNVKFINIVSFFLKIIKIDFKECLFFISLVP